MNTSIPKTVSVKLVISFIIIIFFNCCQHSRFDPEHPYTERGYVMEDATGYFFIPLDKGKGSFLEDIKCEEKITGFKFEIDTFKKDGFVYDTLEDVKKKAEGYPRPYVIKYLTPVEISYYFDSVKGMTLDFPMRFGNDSFTFAYKHEGIHVVSLKPLRR
ncbi:hypothetical protein [Chitinophaga sp. CF118]|uniref:hypothetical protein n=1 Tax=Chitinophaga sp. CF118 TaxID=1884367 RepID=UPI00116033A9|nr:hypothetical protein [Chitinophaga sp. CF118]